MCGYASFLFGWHVHEKAVLLIIIPFSLLALKNRRYLGAFRPLAVAGHVSLFPLLFDTAGRFLKYVNCAQLTRVRISNQDYLHNILAGSLPLCLRPVGPSV